MFGTERQVNIIFSHQYVQKKHLAGDAFSVIPLQPVQ